MLLRGQYLCVHAPCPCWSCRRPVGAAGEPVAVEVVHSGSPPVADHRRRVHSLSATVYWGTASTSTASLRSICPPCLTEPSFPPSPASHCSPGETLRAFFLEIFNEFRSFSGEASWHAREWGSSRDMLDTGWLCIQSCGLWKVLWGRFAKILPPL